MTDDPLWRLTPVGIHSATVFTSPHAPVWDTARQRLVWVDTYDVGSLVHSVNPDEALDGYVVRKINERIVAAVPAQSGETRLVMPQGVFSLSPFPFYGAMEEVTLPGGGRYLPPDTPLTRPHFEMGTPSQGTFIAGLARPRRAPVALRGDRRPPVRPLEL